MFHRLLRRLFPSRRSTLLEESETPALSSDNPVGAASVSCGVFYPYNPSVTYAPLGRAQLRALKRTEGLVYVGLPAQTWFRMLRLLTVYSGQASCELGPRGRFTVIKAITAARKLHKVGYHCED